MTVLDRFLKYVTFDTQSNEETGTTPSTPGQRVFAEALVKELEAIGTVSYTHLDPFRLSSLEDSVPDRHRITRIEIQFEATRTGIPRVGDNHVFATGELTRHK